MADIVNQLFTFYLIEGNWLLLAFLPLVVLLTTLFFHGLRVRRGNIIWLVLMFVAVLLAVVPPVIWVLVEPGAVPLINADTALILGLLGVIAPALLAVFYAWDVLGEPPVAETAPAGALVDAGLPPFQPGPGPSPAPPPIGPVEVPQNPVDIDVSEGSGDYPPGGGSLGESLTDPQPRPRPRRPKPQPPQRTVRPGAGPARPARPPREGAPKGGRPPARVNGRRTIGAMLIDRTTNQTYPLFEGKTKIGRHKENDLVFDDPTISRYHVEIREHGRVFLLTNLSRESDTIVNDYRLSSAAEEQITDGDKITIGERVFRFVTDI